MSAKKLWKDMTWEERLDAAAKLADECFADKSARHCREAAEHLRKQREARS